MRNANEHSRMVMTEEFKAMHKILGGIDGAVKEEGHLAWEKMFAPSHFFLRYTHYLQVGLYLYISISLCLYVSVS